MRSFKLLSDYFDYSAKTYPDKEALIFGEQRYTYSQIYRKANLLAYWFLSQGLRPQQRVLIHLENSPEIVIALYATLKAAGVFTVINYSVPAHKLTYIIGNCEPAIIITDHSKKDSVTRALEQNRLSPDVVLTDGIGQQNDKPASDGFHEWHRLFKDSPDGKDIEERLEGAHEEILDIDLAGLIYTSGSTGDPKGVMSSHRSMIAAAQSIIEYLRNTSGDIILNTLPLSFDYGLYQVVMAFMFGGTVVLEKSFIFLSRILSLISKERVTGFPVVPTIVAMIFRTMNLKEFDLSSLRYMTNTGAALPTGHIRQLREMLPHVQIFSMFGLTECKRISYLPPEEIDRRPGSVGKAMPNCQVYIVNEDVAEVGPHEVGQLLVRGSNVMQGYWRAPDLTVQVFRPALGFADKLLFTGDYFKKDEAGYLYFLGRKDDMIKSRGERISAREVEKVISRFHGINEVVVVGVQDDLLGQAIKAYVVPDPGAETDKKELLKFCSQNLEPYSVPKYVEFRDALPKSTHGKINKKILEG